MSPHDLRDPVTIASVIVRDHLDTVIQRHGQAKGDAVSAAVLRLTTALLGHLPGEAKQARADRPEEEGRTVDAGATDVDTGATESAQSLSSLTVPSAAPEPQA